MQRLKVRSEAERIVALLVSLQATALGTGQKQELLINLEQHAFVIQKQSAVALAKTDKIDYLADGVLFSILPNVKGPPSRPTERINSPCTFLDNCIQFYPDGTITSGALYITDKAQTTLYAITVPVDAIRCIRLYKYTHGSWQIINT